MRVYGVHNLKNMVLVQSIPHIPTLKIYWVCANLGSISDVWQ